MTCADRFRCRVWIASAMAARRARIERALALKKNTKASVAAEARKGEPE